MERQWKIYYLMLIRYQSLFVLPQQWRACWSNMDVFDSCHLLLLCNAFAGGNDINGPDVRWPISLVGRTNGIQNTC
jgi:hypothetical protein